METHTTFMEWKTQHNRDTKSHQNDLEINIYKNPIRCFINTDKHMIKFTWKTKGNIDMES